MCVCVCMCVLFEIVIKLYHFVSRHTQFENNQPKKKEKRKTTFPNFGSSNTESQLMTIFYDIESVKEILFFAKP